ncbi:MAG: alpha/beta fold hydrolase [Actinobacteria bacterium]|nr:alpha/beta fold hydrolase [Actinomycetota bacterium]
MTMLHVGDLEMYYETLGSGDPVLLLHGLGSSSKGWVLQREPFAARHHVILTDLRGHGRTDRPPGPYSVPMFAGDVLGLLDALELRAVNVVGLSMGGMVGFQLAVDHPDRVKSLVAVNAGPALVPSTLRDRFGLWQRRILVNLLPMGKIADTIGNRLFPEPGQAEFLRLFKEGFLENDKAGYKAATRALIGWSVADRIDRISCPVLVVSADQDYTPVSAKQEFVSRMPTARLAVVEHSHHATPIDQAETFNELVLSFLAQVDR